MQILFNFALDMRTELRLKWEFTSSTQRRDGSFASSKTPFIRDRKPFSGDIKYG